MRRPSERTASFLTGVGRRWLQKAGPRADSVVPEVIPEADRGMVLRGLEQARNGEFASDAEVRATFDRFRR